MSLLLKILHGLPGESERVVVAKVKQMDSGLSKREVDRQDSARHASECALEAWLEFLGHRWNALILWRLLSGPRSFSQLADELSGITPKVLTERLSTFVDRGFIERSQGPGFPRRTAYDLTVSGRDVAGQLQHFYDWAARTPLPTGENG